VFDGSCNLGYIYAVYNEHLITPDFSASFQARLPSTEMY
jgi:hypothetical protein